MLHRISNSNGSLENQDETGGTFSTHGGGKKHTQCYPEILKKKRPLGISRRRSGDNVETDLDGRGFEGMGWIQVAQDTVQWRLPVNR
jgi:hypothetical protein